MLKILLMFLLLLAPVPKEAKKKPGIEHGVYALNWGGTPFTATFNGNGEFSEFESDGNGQAWSGRWSWDEKSRTLSVDETRDDGLFRLAWSVVLSPEMNGKIERLHTDIELKPFRPPVVMPDRQ